MPGGTSSSTSDSATKSPKLRETCWTRIAASLTGHLHRRRHARAQHILAFDQLEANREDLVRALVGGLEVARRVLALGVDVLDGRLERAAARIDRDRDLIADVNVTELGLGNVDAQVQLVRF